MNFFVGYDDLYDENARLGILRLLAEQADYRLTEGTIDDLLIQRYAVNKGRGYVRTQLAWLERQAGAIVTRSEGGTTFVLLTLSGADHVMRRHVIPGIKRQGPL